MGSGTNHGGDVVTNSLTIISLGVTLLISSNAQDSDEAKFTTEQRNRKEDQETGQVQSARLQASVDAIHETVKHWDPREGLIRQPIVVASAILDEERTIAFQQDGSLTLAQPIQLGAASHSPLINVSAEWVIDGLPSEFGLYDRVIGAESELPLCRIPTLPTETTASGVLLIKFADTAGFRGFVEQPFRIKRCHDHVHLTIERHNRQSWLPPNNVLTN